MSNYQESRMGKRVKALMNVFAVIVIIALGIGIVSPLVADADTMLAQEEGYDLSIYGNRSWTPTANDHREYIDDNFWVHEYLPLNATRCGGLVTHTGRDTHPPGGIVKSYGYGRLKQDIQRQNCTDGYHTLTIQNLLNSGEVVNFNLLHMSDHYTGSIPLNGLLVKYQQLGVEGGAGGFPIHLHLEVSNQICTGCVLSANASPHGIIARSPQPQTLGLEAHFDSTTPQHIYYHPDKVVDYHELLPYLSTSPNPSATQYTVFGRANNPLYGALIFQRQATSKNAQVGINVRRGGNRSINQADIQPLSNENRTLAGITSIYANSSYTEGDYLFTPFVDAIEGYPILFSILAHSNSVIIDNDQLDLHEFVLTSNVPDTNSNSPDSDAVPGYFLKAQLFKGGSGVSAQWRPNFRDKEGRYNVSIYIPRIYSVPSATQVQYTIVGDGISQENKLVNLNYSQEGMWLPIGEFSFKEGGYIELNLGNTVNLNNINVNTWVAFDAIKFEYSRPLPCEFSDVPSSNSYKTAIKELCVKGVVDDDGVFQPEQFVTRSEFCKILVLTAKQVLQENLLAPMQNREEKTFSDVEGSWYEGFVNEAYKAGIIDGYPEGDFKPENSINHAEASKMVLKTFKLFKESELSLIDQLLDKWKWYRKYINRCYELGIMTDDHDPKESVSRGEMADIIYKAYHKYLDSPKFKMAPSFGR